MEKKKYLVTILFLIILLILGEKVFAISNLEVNMLSQEYIDWLKLSDEEKENTIQPVPFEIEYTDTSKNRLTSKSRMKASGKSTLIPGRYDLREHIDVEIKNQGITNFCWAFSSCSALETHLALKEETWNFSERHIEYSTASNFKDGTNKGSLDRRVGSGGNSYNSFAYFSRGDGPILEEDMPFVNNENIISINDMPEANPVKHVEGMKFFPAIKKEYNNNQIVYKDSKGIEYSDSDLTNLRNEIKEHIMQYGGVTAVIKFEEAYLNTETSAYNMNVANASTNHVVTIIGWDDNYNANNFINKPSINGAYIVLNSWGDFWGQNGIFYVSYEDILIERYLSGITQVSDIDYDHIYQYDMSVMAAYMQCQYCANKFIAERDENLTEIVVALPSNQICDIKVIVNGEKVTQIASNVSMHSGYNSVKLSNPIELEQGDVFSVIVKIVDFDNKGVAIESNTYYPSVTSSSEESFGSVNGEDWFDLYSELGTGKNFIIKALTQEAKESEITSIEIRKLPEKLNYLQGEELNINGIVLVEIYENGTEKLADINNTNLQISGFNSNWLGEETITITYKGFSVEFNIYIHNKEIESEVYEVEDEYISAISANTTILNFKENLSFYKEDYIIFEDNKEVTDNSALIKTGQLLVIGNNAYQLVVIGDINGDGKIKASDLSAMKKALTGNIELTGAYYKAADVNGDNNLKASDMSKLKAMLIGE